ncbi:Bacterial regulatory protein, luxR family [Novipirellula aureliae]|uniref:Bacterial regulatory protein, luxR family n=1 Tax=Novipirellula aureliae TaxID=2527966 RepID=A0A5C6DVV2_9BACT|nr:helix-turn-helix transcriptional regulator [Novipirellula aureliae]TWU40374.1 Bacterial regulatory protein, luxR family [Novipirellula aureliae]
MGNLFDAIDWADIFRVEPGIGLTILSKDGAVIYGNDAAYALFGIAPPSSDDGELPRKLSDIFHPEFVKERLAWINQVIVEGKPLRAKHIYDGQQIVSTIYPVGESTALQFRDSDSEESGVSTDAESDAVTGEEGVNHYALIISRHDQGQDSPSIDTVTSQYIDLGCLSSLSKRELQIFILLGHGNSVPEVGRMLHRSPRTIERHKTEIGRKLGYSSLAEIARSVGHLGLTYDHIQLERFKARADEEKT